MNVSSVSAADMSISPALHYSCLGRDMTLMELLTISLNFMESVFCCVTFPHIS